VDEVLGSAAERSRDRPAARASLRKLVARSTPRLARWYGAFEQGASLPGGAQTAALGAEAGACDGNCSLKGAPRNSPGLLEGHSRTESVCGCSPSWSPGWWGYRGHLDVGARCEAKHAVPLLIVFCFHPPKRMVSDSEFPAS
jgi:hypothetical protein